VLRGRRAATAVACLAVLLASATILSVTASELPDREEWRIYVGPPVPVTAVRLVGGKPTGCLDFNVSPPDTRIFVDGRLVGTVGEYDGWPDKLYLPPGEYRLRLNGPRGLAWRGRVTVRAYRQVSVRLHLSS
jgi:hypothetical protein